MKLSELLKETRVLDVIGDSNVDIKDISCDSRTVNKDGLFVCIKGFKTDGNEYIKSAIEKGAVCIVSEDSMQLPEGVTLVKVENSRIALAQIANTFFDHPSKKFNLIGVTGTNGKTTTTYLIKSILEKNGHKVGLVGTIANMIGDNVIPTERTTPDALELQRLFSKMVEEKVTSVVMEVSSHSLDLNRVFGCDFDIGIFTNLTQDHLDYHVTLENYLNAKIKLFKMCNHSVINIDDNSSGKVIAEAAGDVLTFGIDNKPDLRGQDIEISDKGAEFNFNYDGTIYNVCVPIPGRFTVYNALGAIGACSRLGISMKEIIEGINGSAGVPGRSEVVNTGRDFTVIVDYAHTPDGIENILNSVRQFAKGRVVTLFGCGGDRDKTKRPIMGEIAGRLSDFCIVTSDNPRTEDPNEIINQVEAGVRNTDCEYIKIENRKDAIEYALKNAKKDDIIVLAGKGHEPYQVLKDRTIHFDEREIVKEILSTF